MNVLLWVVAGILAALFAAAGGMKLTQPKAKLAESGMDWVEDVESGVVKFIGGAELAGAIGLVLPAVTDIAPILVPIAATGLAVTMAGAVVTHVRRNEGQGIAVASVLFVLCAVVAWGRFGPNSF